MYKFLYFSPSFLAAVHSMTGSFACETWKVPCATCNCHNTNWCLTWEKPKLSSQLIKTAPNDCVLRNFVKRGWMLNTYHWSNYVSCWLNVCVWTALMSFRLIYSVVIADFKLAGKINFVFIQLKRACLKIIIKLESEMEGNLLDCRYTRGIK